MAEPSNNIPNNVPRPPSTPLKGPLTNATRTIITRQKSEAVEAILQNGNLTNNSFKEGKRKISSQKLELDTNLITNSVTESQKDNRKIDFKTDLSSKVILEENNFLSKKSVSTLIEKKTLKASSKSSSSSSFNNLILNNEKNKKKILLQQNKIKEQKKNNKVEKEKKFGQVTVKTILGTNFQIKVDFFNIKFTVQDLKLLISEQEDLAVESIILVFGEKVLKDDKETLYNLKIQDGSTLKLVIQMAGGPGPPTRIKNPIKEDDSIVLLLCKQNEELYMLELHMKNAKQRRAAASQFFKLASLRPSSSTCQLLSEISGLTKEELCGNKSFEDFEDSEDNFDAEEVEEDYDFEDDSHSNNNFDTFGTKKSRPKSTQSSISTGTFLSMIGASSISAFNSRPGSAESITEEELFKDFYNSGSLFLRSAPMSAKSARADLACDCSKKNYKSAPNTGFEKKKLKLRPATAICLMRLPDLDTMPFVIIPSKNRITKSNESLIQSNTRPTSSKTNVDVEDSWHKKDITFQSKDTNNKTSKNENFLPKILSNNNSLSNSTISSTEDENKRDNDTQYKMKGNQDSSENFTTSNNPISTRKIKSSSSNMSCTSKKSSNTRISFIKTPLKKLKRLQTAVIKNNNSNKKPEEKSNIIKLKCEHCKKKLGLANNFKCKCGKSFCALHRYSDRHDCAYDYKAASKSALIKDNPLIISEKVLKL
ncbi:AN1-type zinc finger protein 5 [Lobulomyces angularis]|nr:AN1-type zinc finger protein 5 [Lobulomyces angularis]